MSFFLACSTPPTALFSAAKCKHLLGGVLLALLSVSDVFPKDKFGVFSFLIKPQTGRTGEEELGEPGFVQCLGQDKAQIPL